MPNSKERSTFGNLPIHLNTFIGRENEIRGIHSLILSNRLVTLTGPGGFGKTRLVFKVAQELMREMLGESLSVRTEISDRGGIAWCLEKLAEAKFEQEQFEEAAKIFGHAESIRTPIGSVIDPADRENYRHILFATWAVEKGLASPVNDTGNC